MMGTARRILREPGGECYQTAVRAVVQRVSRAEVRVAAEVTGRIGRGLVVLLGAGDDDTDADLGYLVDKVVGLRIFADDDSNMNRSVVDVGGALLIVSQFTLYGGARKGRRPSFVMAIARARRSGASEPEMVGMGARTPGMAGTGVADAEGYDATYTNPAGLVGPPARRLPL